MERFCDGYISSKFQSRDRFMSKLMQAFPNQKCTFLTQEKVKIVIIGANLADYYAR